MAEGLRRELLKLLREDEEFRYAVAGLLGLEEVLRRLGRHEELLAKLWEELRGLREDFNRHEVEEAKRFQAVEERLRLHDEEMRRLREDFNRHEAESASRFKAFEEEMRRLRVDLYEGFQRHDEELAKLREDMVKGFQRYDEQLIKLREDMNKGFQRYDEELAKLRKEMYEGFQRHDEELAKLREDMNRGLELVNRHLSALGARWGLMAEEAFREGLRGVVERELGLRVERWVYSDREGRVYGYPCEVEVDVVVSDERVLLIEVASHVRASDVAAFRRKAELYEEATGRRPSRLIMVSPFVEEEAFKAGLRLGVEFYTRV